MHVAGKDKNNEGKFSYEVYCGASMVEFGGNYPTMRDAEVAARTAERMLMNMGYEYTGPVIKNDYMTLDDIIAALSE